MSLPCIPCAEPQECLEGLDQYTLQDEVLLFVFICPPSQYCGRNNFLFILCCDGNQIRVDFTVGMSVTARDRLITNAVTECERRRAFCEPPPPPPPDCLTPPCPPIEYFYSAPASCSVYCPDGSPFTYTVQAGLFLAKTLAEAQAAADAYVCEQAPISIKCLGDIPRCACLGTLYRAVIGSNSSVTGLRWSVIGALPPGLTLTPNGSVAVISGVPLLAGQFGFQVSLTDPSGNYGIKTYTIQVLAITTAVITPFTPGVPYSFQLTASGGSGNYGWFVNSGTLPAGLELSFGGLISGTPELLAASSA